MIPIEAVLFLAGLLAFVLIGLAYSRDGARKAVLERVARSVGGTVAAASWIREPRVDFRLAGRDARLEFFAGSKGASPYSRVSVSLGGLFPGTLHILESGFGQTFLKLFGAQDLEIGDASFDADYVVKATPESLAARVFSPERRTALIRTVRRLRNLSDPTISVTAHQLTVTARQFLRDEVSIQSLITTAREVLDHVLTKPAPAGVEIGELKPGGEGICPVCGTGMDARSPRCGDCRTGQHAECWAYLGRCATYACRGTAPR